VQSKKPNCAIDTSVSAMPNISLGIESIFLNWSNVSLHYIFNPPFPPLHKHKCYAKCCEIFG